MKRTVAVLFGGCSTEHEVSCMSAANIISQIDRDNWNVLLIGITKSGMWLNTEKLDAVRDGSWVHSQVRAELSPDAVKKCVRITDVDGRTTDVPVDLVFPVLHGKNGEDGTIQGLLELAQIPYVGCGVLCSAVSMDKFYTKLIVGQLGIRQARFVGVRRHELGDMRSVIARVQDTLPYPVFVKPSKAGSSCGVSKASNAEELTAALQKAMTVDDKALVEEFIQGHEVECAVLMNEAGISEASGVGEILAAAEFYDYDAKYNNPESRTIIDPQLPGNAAEEIRQAAVKIFTAVDGYGLSRVDFFVTEAGEVVFNEINTMPGFTAISMYPMLWEARGISKKVLVAKLMESGLRRFA